MNLLRSFHPETVLLIQAACQL
ncbi:hypothetical protein VCHENC03_2864A, partial [Vibrio sp. HENC-03]